MNLQSFSGQTGGKDISALLNKPDSACFPHKIRKTLSCFNSNPIKNVLQSISDCLLETQPCFIKFSDVFQYRSAEPCCRQLHDVLRYQCQLPLAILGCWFINEFCSMLSCFASSLTILRCFLQVPLKNLRLTAEYPALGFSLLMYPAVRSISPTMCPAVGSLLYQYADVDIAVGSSLHRCTDFISLSRSSLHRCTDFISLSRSSLHRCTQVSVLLILDVPLCRCTPQAIMSYSIRHAVNANSEVTHSSKTGLFCLFFFLSRFYYCNRSRHGIPIVAFPIVPLTLHKNKREHAESLKIVHFYVKIFSDISGPDYLSVSSAL